MSRPNVMPRAYLVYVQRIEKSVHLWVGPFGIHIFWPDIWKSRTDYCTRWKETP